MKIPISEVEAAKSVVWLLDRESELQSVPDDEIKEVWAAISFLYPGLNPDGIPDHGEPLAVLGNRINMSSMEIIDERLLNPYDVISGWPLHLLATAHEVQRRYMADRLTDEEYYPSAAQRAGMIFRNPELAQTE